MTDDKALVSVEGAGVRGNGRWLIEGIDLQIGRGEIVTLIGPNGSGKSTTARMILGLQPADAGRIERQRGIRIGYVPQKLSISRTLPLTVERLMTLTHRYDADQIHEALAAVDITPLAQRQVHDLSGGEFQRALLARSLISKPDLLVLDEPVQGVDFTGEIQLYELIRKVRDTIGCGILLISHDLHVVMAHTDRVICLNGHVCCHGTPQSVAGDPEYIRLFGRHGARSLAIYKHDHDHSHGPDGSVQPVPTSDQTDAGNAGQCAGGDHTHH